MSEAAVMVRSDPELSGDFKRDRLLEIKKDRDDLATWAYHTLVHPADR